MLKTPEAATSLPAFADRYGLSLTSVYTLIKRQKLRAVKLLGKTVVLAEDEAEFCRSLPAWQPTAPGDWRRELAHKLNERKRRAKAAEARA